MNQNQTNRAKVKNRCWCMTAPHELQPTAPLLQRVCAPPQLAAGGGGQRVHFEK
jgi:hypothetical protein